MPVPTSKTPIGRGVIILKLIVYNKIQEEVSLRISACALFSLQPYAYGRSALKHASSRVLALDDLLRSLPTWMHSVILWGVDCCHGLSWVRAELYCPALASVIRDRIPATHQLTLQSTPCSSPFSFLFQKYFWEPADLLRDFTDGLTYFCFDTGTKKRSMTRSVKLCGSGCWYQSLFILFHEYLLYSSRWFSWAAQACNAGKYKPEEFVLSSVLQVYFIFSHIYKQIG